MSCILCHASDEVVDELDFNDYESEACSKCRARLFHLTSYWRYQNVGEHTWILDKNYENPEDTIIESIDSDVCHTSKRHSAIDLIDVLPDKKRRIVYMYIWEGKSFRTIGEVFGCSKQAIHQQYRHALKLLRDAYPDVNLWKEQVDEP